MAATEFVTARYPDAEMPKVQTAAGMRTRVRGFIKGRARIREQGGDFGPYRTEANAVERIMARTSKMGVGPKIVVQRESDREMLSIREVTKVPDLGAAPALEAIHAAVWDRFPVRSGGLWLCRFVDGTRTVSKHGYLTSTWKGAAEDIFVLEGGMPKLTDVADFIVALTRQRHLRAATVIVDTSIWTPSGGWRTYGGNRHFHVHVDVSGGSACSP